MRVSILGPKETIWQGGVRDLILPTEEGDICVLDFHQPFLVRLTKGDIRLEVMSRKPLAVNKIPIKDGVARMYGNELIILVEV